jgi:hypothetical protein
MLPLASTVPVITSGELVVLYTTVSALAGLKLAKLKKAEQRMAAPKFIERLVGTAYRVIIVSLLLRSLQTKSRYRD